MSTHYLYPSAWVITILAGMALPLLTGLGTKLGANSIWKVGLNAVLSVVTGAIASLAGSPQKGFELYSFLYATGLAFLSSISTYRGIWKPLGVTQAVQAATPGVGLGSQASPTPYNGE